MYTLCTQSDCHSYVIPLTDSAIYFFNSNAIYNDYYCLFLFSNSITSSMHKLKIVSINLNAHFVFHFAIALCAAESFIIVSNSIVFLFTMKDRCNSSSKKTVDNKIYLFFSLKQCFNNTKFVKCAPHSMAKTM